MNFVEENYSVEYDGILRGDFFCSKALHSAIGVYVPWWRGGAAGCMVVGSQSAALGEWRPVCGQRGGWSH